MAPHRRYGGRQDDEYQVMAHRLEVRTRSCSRRCHVNVMLRAIAGSLPHRVEVACKTWDRSQDALSKERATELQQADKESPLRRNLVSALIGGVGLWLFLSLGLQVIGKISPYAG